MSVDLEELKRLAREATQGGWFVGRVYRKCTRDHGPRGHGGPDCVHEEFARDATYEENGTEICSDAGDEVVGSGVEGAHVSEPNARFIAAANPAAVLALIERVERAEAEAEKYKAGILIERGLSHEFKQRWGEEAEKRILLGTRVSHLEALARKGLEVYHGGKVCRASLGTRPENPAECEYEACRDWAQALEGERGEAKSVQRGENMVRVYEMWKRNPDGSTTTRLECAECGHVFREALKEGK